MDKIHLYLENGAKCWFTSDQHFNHTNVMRFCGRPWNDVREMNQALIDKWNDVVTDNDIVFILGDFCWDKDNMVFVKNIINQLTAGQIFVVPGNHDSTHCLSRIKDLRFQMTSDIVSLFISGIDEDKPTRQHEVVLSHFPLATWSHWYRGVPNLHGHIHSGPRCRGEVDIPGADLVLKNNLTYDVGVDNNNYKPIEIRDILTKLNKNENL